MGVGDTGRYTVGCYTVYSVATLYNSVATICNSATTLYTWEGCVCVFQRLHYILRTLHCRLLQYIIQSLHYIIRSLQYIIQWLEGAAQRSASPQRSASKLGVEALRLEFRVLGLGTTERFKARSKARSPQFRR